MKTRDKSAEPNGRSPEGVSRRDALKSFAAGFALPLVAEAGSRSRERAGGRRGTRGNNRAQSVV